MKLIKAPLLVMAMVTLLSSCSKPSDEEDNDPDCMTNNTTKVTFKNTGSTPLRVEVAVQLTPQYEALDPVVKHDLAPGASITREFPANRYMVVWKSGCPGNCTLATGVNGRTYESCEEYEEARGV